MERGRAQLGVVVDEARVEGGVAFALGRTRGAFLPRGASDGRAVDRKHLAILVRDAQGRWRLRVLAGNDSS
jgi:hypothetical protein